MFVQFTASEISRPGSGSGPMNDTLVKDYRKQVEMTDEIDSSDDDTTSYDDDTDDDTDDSTNKNRLDLWLQ